MSDNGNTLLILKVELIDKKLKVTFGHDVPNTLLYDRAARLLNLELDNMLIGSSIEKKSPIIIGKKPVGDAILDKMRKGFISQ